MFYSKSGAPIQEKAWHKKAVKLALKGRGATEIAVKLLGRKSQESTVRDFLSKVDLSRKEVAEVLKGAGDDGEVGMKILFWDIETSPKVSAHWGDWQQNIHKEATVRQAGILSHAWSWGLGVEDGEEPKVYSSVLTPKEAINNDYERIVHEAWSLLDNADVVVAHNGRKFDIRKMNAEFIKLGLPPPSPYKVYDTLRVAKRFFYFDRNDLDSLCKTLKVPYRKVKHEGMPLWMQCISGDQGALSRMEDYNKGDIPTLRGVFKKLQPWDNQAINFSLYTDNSGIGCPYCGHGEVEPTGKLVYTATKSHSHYRCNGCGANMKSNVTSKGVNMTRIAG